MNDDDKIIETPEPDEKDPPKDELAEYRNDDGTFSEEKIKKLAEDRKYYRQKISQLKQIPEKEEEYDKDFVLDSKFDAFASKEENQAKIKSLFDKINKLSKEKGIGIERNHDIKRFVMDELVEAKAIDLASDEQKKAAEQKVIDERNEAVRKEIGDVTDINAWNDALCDWLKGFCNSEAEYNMHKALLERNSLWALSLNKVRHAMMGNKIPVAAPQATYNEEEWNRAFRKADREEQDRMLKERAEMLLKNRK
jgi:hypothetical protein